MQSDVSSCHTYYASQNKSLFKKLLKTKYYFQIVSTYSFFVVHLGKC